MNRRKFLKKATIIAGSIFTIAIGIKEGIIDRHRSIMMTSSGSVKSAYYFDDINGIDTNNGLTPGTAFQTITKCNAMATTNPTWKRLFRGGGTFRGLIYPQPNQYFGGYGSGKPKVYGSAGFDSNTTWTVMSSAPAETGNLDNETFEGSGSGGYVESWTQVLGAGSVLDPANQDITRSADGGSYILKVQKVASNYNALTKHDMGSNKAITYTRVCVNVTAEGLSDNDSLDLIRTQDSALADVWKVVLKKQTGEAYSLDFYCFTGGVFSYHGQKTGVNLNQWYKIEVLYDATHAHYNFRVDGASVLGGQQILTSTYKAGIEWLRLGEAETSKTITVYYDRVAVDSGKYLADTIAASANTWKSIHEDSPDTVWFIDGNGTIHWGNKAASIAAIVSLYDWFTDGSYIYVQSGGTDAGHNPHTVWGSIEASNQSHCFWWSPNDYHNITVDGFEMAYCSGVAISGRTGWEIKNNTIHHIGINSGTNDSVGAEISGGSNGWIHNNFIYEVKHHCININSWNPYDASNNIIEKNTIYNSWNQAINLSTGTAPSNQSGNIVRYNKIYWDANFLGSLTSTRGIEVMSTSQSQDALIYYNLIYGMPQYGISLDDNTINTVLYNNTIKAVIGIAVVSNGVSGIILKNNLTPDSTNYSLYVADKTRIAACDYNCWYTSFTNYARIGLTNYTAAQFATYKSDTGFDTHGKWQDPKVVSPTDFHLRAGSPCIGTGVAISLTVDVDGGAINTPPDMGAYKY